MAADDKAPLPLSPGALLCLLEWVDNSSGEFSPVCGICDAQSDEAQLTDGIHHPSCSLDLALDKLGMDRHEREKVRQSFRGVIRGRTSKKPSLGIAARKALREEREASGTPAKAR